jgi:hypothetical protein
MLLTLQFVGQSGSVFREPVLAVAAPENGSHPFPPSLRDESPIHVQPSTTAHVAIVAGWNLLSLPVQSGITSTAGLAGAVSAQVGASAVSSVATYRDGRFSIYIPGYAADQPLSPAQGAFVLSTRAGTWSPSGTPYVNPQTVYLQSGWNLVAAPFPAQDLDASLIAGEVGGCVQEIVVYTNQTVHVWVPGAGAFAVPHTGGMWIRCSTATPWSPMPPAPPDPATVAPPVDQSVATNTGAATQFLYTGTNPIQTGVTPGTIDQTRATVLRGKVSTRDGNPLTGVMISILDHPEFGQTESRADGKFDIAANGGSLLTVVYAKNGYLPIQRQVQSPAGDYASVPDVVMIPVDSQVTSISFGSSSVQVAQGSAQSDTDGTRRATLLFMPGTTASMTLPDGSTQPLDTGHVRATEYTVGSSGPQAMPGTLPPTEGYTYAADFGLDEASQAGATSVQFSQPVISYTQNFLKWAVGTKVPSRYLDKSTGQWVEGQSGVVIKILSVTGGMADLDVDGTGPASTSKLAALGITDAERQQLASLYPVGQTLWRMPIRHFTDWDF